MHDFKLFKQSRVLLCPETECLADSGYLGLKKCHDNSRLPSKNTNAEQEHKIALTHK